MKEIDVAKVIDEVEKMCLKANYFLNPDISSRLEEAKENDPSELSRNILGILLKNADIAAEEHMPMCQDTGMAILFVSLGQEIHITGGALTEAINEGVRRGYEKGYLRKSVVQDPIRRVNTKDNTPAIIHYEVVPGDQLVLELAPKGFGSENMSKLAMLKPSDGMEGVREFVLKTVKEAGPNPCPPIVVGVGIGGSFEKCALLAKKALLRPLNERHPDPYYAELENELLAEINRLGIGPQGFGGQTTALGVNVEVYATHIAGLPVAVNISCHATRHSIAVL